MFKMFKELLLKTDYAILREISIFKVVVPK